jgi:hypothetical protein
MLIEEVSLGDRNAPNLAEQLVKKYPNDAVAAIAEGVKKTQADYVRSSLVSAAASMLGHGPVDFLRDQMKNGATIDVKVVAADGLRNHAFDSEATDSMIELWKQTITAKGDWGDASTNIGRFLIADGVVKSIEALTDHWNDRPVDARMDLLDHVTSDRVLVTLNDRDVRRAVEQFLQTVIEDPTPRMGLTGGRNGVNYSNPRVSDMAAYVLNHIWPTIYQFNLGATQSLRDRQILAIRNRWRSEKGLPLIPEPARPEIVAVEEKVAAPLVEAMLAASVENRAAATDKIASLGLGAIPLVKARVSQSTDEASRQVLTQAHQTLSLIVREVNITNPASDQRSINEAIAPLKGKPLATEGYRMLARALRNASRPFQQGIEMTIRRPDDETGVVIEAKLLPQQPDANWQLHLGITAGTEMLHNSFGGTSSEFFDDARYYGEFERTLAKALATPPSTELLIHLQIGG